MGEKTHGRRALAQRTGTRRFDSAPRATDVPPVSEVQSSHPRVVIVRDVPIELCAFIKFAGLAESGGAAKQLIAAGEVYVNGRPETRKRKQLVAGDRVSVEGTTLVVQTAGGTPTPAARRDMTRGN